MGEQQFAGVGWMAATLGVLQVADFGQNAAFSGVFLLS